VISAIVVGVLAVVATVAATGPARAEEIEKKFRIGFALGALNGTDEVNSDSANVLSLVDRDEQLVDRYIDPRNDSAVFNNLKLRPGGIATLYGQYAVNRFFVLEASVGYQKTDLGNVEVQAQFAGTDVPETQPFLFDFFTVKAGDIERIPLQFTALARFRPRASFNPYVGAGVGYSFIGYTPSDEFNQLSINMDSSRGGFAGVTSAFFGNPEFSTPNASEIRDLGGATVDARDTFEWHVAGGAEYSFRRKWALFIDLRYIFSSREIHVGFDGGADLGIAVPQLVDYVDSPAASASYGAIQITEGGLVDGGQAVIVPVAGDGPPGISCVNEPFLTECVNFCSQFPQRCESRFDPTRPDGQRDVGFYYVQGGDVKLGGISFQIGVRYTF